MPIPTSARLIWPETNASIPANWSEDTAFAVRYMQGADETFTGSSNFGAGSHTHSATAHSHTGNSHTHSFSGSSITASSVSISVGPPIANPSSPDTHSHSSVTSNSTIISYQSVSANIQGISTVPPSVKIIIISPDDAVQDIPDDAVCFTDETILPTGFSKTDGSGGTPDLDGRFLKTVNAGGDSDISGFGSLTHTHSQSFPGSHSHSQGHIHVAKLSGSSLGLSQTPGSVTVYNIQHHNVDLETKNTSTIANSDNTSAGSSEQEYIEMLGIQNTSGSSLTRKGVILPYTGHVNTIPNDWKLCDGNNGTPDLRDKQIKVTVNDGNIGNTGGVATHTHTLDHGHTGQSHNHTAKDITTGGQSGGVGLVLAANAGIPDRRHVHVWTVGSTVPTLQDTVATYSDTNIGLLHRKVVFIKYVGLIRNIIHMKGVIPYAR